MLVIDEFKVVHFKSSIWFVRGLLSAIWARDMVCEIVVFLLRRGGLIDVRVAEDMDKFVRDEVRDFCDHVQ